MDQQQQQNMIIDIISSSDEEEEEEQNAEQNSSNNSNATTTTTTTSTTTEQALQQRQQKYDKIRQDSSSLLLGLAHAWSCTNTSTCRLPKCAALKKLSQHVAACPKLANCTVPYCATSKILMVHYRTCKLNPQQHKQCRMCQQLVLNKEPQLEAQNQKNVRLNLKEVLDKSVRVQMMYAVSNVLNTILNDPRRASDTKIVSFVENELVLAAKSREAYEDRSTLRQRVAEIYSKKFFKNNEQNADRADANWKSQSSKLSDVTDALRKNMMNLIARVIFYHYRDVSSSYWYNCSTEKLQFSASKVEQAIFAKCNTQQDYLRFMNNHHNLKVIVELCNQKFLKPRKERQEKTQTPPPDSCTIDLASSPIDSDNSPPTDDNSNRNCNRNSAPSNVIEECVFNAVPVQTVDMSDESLPEQEQNLEPSASDDKAQEQQQQDAQHQIEDDGDSSSAEIDNRFESRLIAVADKLVQDSTARPKGAKLAFAQKIRKMIQGEVDAAASKAVVNGKCDCCVGKSECDESSSSSPKQGVESSKPRPLTDAEELIRTQQIFLKQRQLEKLRVQVDEAKKKLMNLSDNGDGDGTDKKRRKLRMEYF